MSQLNDIYGVWLFDPSSGSYVDKLLFSDVHFSPHKLQRVISTLKIFESMQSRTTELLFLEFSNMRLVFVPGNLVIVLSAPTTYSESVLTAIGLALHRELKRGLGKDYGLRASFKKIGYWSYSLQNIENQTADRDIPAALIQ